MEQVSQAMRNHHRELAGSLSAQVDALAEGRNDADPQALVEFLETDLLPHARGEEASLYPAMDVLVREHGKPTATMSIDHEYIGSYVRQIKDLSRTLANAPESKQPEVRRQLTRLALQLQALFEVHLQKEERVYLPLLEEYLTPEEQQSVLSRMHEAYV